MLDRKSEDLPSDGENLRKGTRDSVFFSPSGLARAFAVAYECGMGWDSPEWNHDPNQCFSTPESQPL